MAVIYTTYAVAKRKPCTGTSLNFSRLSFRNCVSCVYDCDDLPSNNFFTPQFTYMIFIFSISSSSFHGFITNQFYDLQLACQLNWQSESRTSLNFFQAFFSQLHKLCIYLVGSSNNFFTPQFRYMIFIYSIWSTVRIPYKPEFFSGGFLFATA